MGCPRQARTKPRRKLAIATLSGSSPDGGRRQCTTCGAWPHVAASHRASMCAMAVIPARQAWRHTRGRARVQQPTAGHLLAIARPAHDLILAIARPARANARSVDPSLGSDITVGDNGGSGSRFSGAQRKFKNCLGICSMHQYNSIIIHRMFIESLPFWRLGAWLQPESQGNWLLNCRRRDTASRGPTTIVTPKSQFRTDPSDYGKAPSNIAHDPLGITDSACKNQLVVVSVQYGPFYTYIPIRSTTIGKSRVAIDPIAMHTSWRSNSDITSVSSIGYPRIKASGESSTTKHRLLHASGPHPIPPPNDSNTTKTPDLSTRQMVTTWKVRVGDPDPPPGQEAEEQKFRVPGGDQYEEQFYMYRHT
ncbi:DNA topoisomerase 3-alpha [Dorcoceras hygrometricum]|uniref:DNA topoisomerase 3-alpha n=1 Tax=Dorcoceras hygrometricum TaxID=472368 RepID=A0A2Z7CCU0_9LAMI|nr:DNA topoisomerase 3-alpha [Dorcoceras hygrometricum]